MDQTNKPILRNSHMWYYVSYDTAWLSMAINHHWPTNHPANPCFSHRACGGPRKAIGKAKISTVIVRHRDRGAETRGMAEQRERVKTQQLELTESQRMVVMKNEKSWLIMDGS